MLESKCDAVAHQFMSQALFVFGLQQAETQGTTNFDDAANDSIGKIVEFHLRALRVLRGDSTHSFRQPRGLSTIFDQLRRQINQTIVATGRQPTDFSPASISSER